jgi:putative tryptophan/tyrosine transport system substrate-binding protein
MQRREFIRVLAGGTFFAQQPFLALAQGVQSRPLIAILVLNSASSVSIRLRGFLQTMRDIGYVEGRDFTLVERYGDGQLDRLPILADELARLKPSLFITGSVPATFAAKRASETTPIICVSLADPVGLGLVASEARPGGQVTGTLDTVDGLSGKQLALAAEAIPGATRVGLLVNGGNQGHSLQRQGAEAAASKLALTLTSEDVRSPNDVDEAFQDLMRKRIQMLLVLQDPIFLKEAQRIAALAAGVRLPTIYTIREFVEAGGMMSYGVSLTGNWRRVAFYVDKIFKGAKPGDLPVELPTKLELVINLKTAKAIGFKFPESFLLRADEVIE